MRILFGCLAVVVAFALSGVAFIHSGIYDVTAAEEHSDLGKWALHTTMKKSVQARADEIDVPQDLSSEDMIRQGARAYDQLCAACHLKPGQENTLLRQGLNPMPPSLVEGGHFGPAEQFWVIKNGIKMTGMPAWGNTHADEDLWELTAFVQKLPELSEAEYKEMVQLAMAGADDGHDHDHGNMRSMMEQKAPHGEPGHHAEQPTVDTSADGPAGHHGQDEPSGHHAHMETPGEKSTNESDHFSDGHTH
ncbi:cytochrome c [Marinobacter sp. R17]|nr:cytochrome c [Marinobacter sp. R17]